MKNGISVLGGFDVAYPGTVIRSTIKCATDRAAQNANGVLLFAASDGATGIELWKSDGTTAGTVVVNYDTATGALNCWKRIAKRRVRACSAPARSSICRSRRRSKPTA